MDLVMRVCHARGITVSKLRDQRKQSRAVARIRHECMYLLRNETILSYRDIARACGRCDHSSAFYGIAQVEDAIEARPAYGVELRALVDAKVQTFAQATTAEAERVATATDAAQPWANDAAGDERANQEAITKVLDLRFGEKRVIADPSDPEGTKLAMSQGYTVIPGGTLSGDVWSNVRKFGAALPAGKVTPSPKPYSPDGDRENVIPRSEWKPEYELFYDWVARLGTLLLGHPVSTRFVKESGVYWRATFGGLSMALNVSKLGPLWWSKKEDMLALVLHEFGHHYSGDHLSEDYHRALCALGANLAIRGVPEFSGP
jgi:Bacterial dnaA protein helix-turn-helix